MCNYESKEFMNFHIHRCRSYATEEATTYCIPEEYHGPR
jgi:hypothetical protein